MSEINGTKILDEIKYKMDALTRNRTVKIHPLNSTEPQKARVFVLTSFSRLF
jgi:hypothetical protein